MWDAVIFELFFLPGNFMSKRVEMHDGVLLTVIIVVDNSVIVDGGVVDFRRRNSD